MVVLMQKHMYDLFAVTLKMMGLDCVVKKEHHATLPTKQKHGLNKTLLV